MTQTHSQHWHRMVSDQLESKLYILPLALAFPRLYRWPVGAPWSRRENYAVGVGEDVSFERGPNVSGEGETN